MTAQALVPCARPAGKGGRAGRGRKSPRTRLAGIARDEKKKQHQPTPSKSFKQMNQRSSKQKITTSLGLILTPAYLDVLFVLFVLFVFAL